MASFMEQFIQNVIDNKNYLEQVANGSMSASDYYGWYNTHEVPSLTAEQEKWLDNLLANQRTNEARQWEEDMASNDLLRAGSQLQQLGLSPSGVLQTGGSSVNGVASADTVKTNLANQRYERQNAIARSLISMVSAMAHAGITGGSIGIVRSVASKTASQAAHSASDMISRESARQAFIQAGLEEHYKKNYGY